MADVSSVSSSSTLDQLGQQYQAILVQQSITPLQTQQDALNNRLTALNTLKTKMQALYDTAKGLTLTGSNSKFQTYTVSSTAPSIVTGSATSTSLSGTHTMKVSQLAKMDMVLSDQEAITGAGATSIVDAEGAGTKTIRISINNVDTDINVSLNGGETNSDALSAIATAINGASSGVTASVVNDTASTGRLVLTNTNYGSANAITLSDQSGTLLSSLGLGSGVVAARTAQTGAKGGYVTSDVNALDSKFNLDGIDITRQSNSVSDVLNGVTLNLTGVQGATDTPATISVGVNKDAVQGTIQDFITKYNDVINYLNDNSTIDVKAGIRGVFSSDSSMRLMRSDLRGMVMGSVSSVQSGSISMLTDLGVTIGTDGTLSLSDTSKLTTALSTNPSKVSDIFNSTNGIASQFKSYLDQYVSYGGEMDSETHSVDSQVDNLASRMTRINAQINTRVQNYVMQFAQIQQLLQDAMNQQQMIQTLFGTTSTTG